MSILDRFKNKKEEEKSVSNQITLSDINAFFSRKNSKVIDDLSEVTYYTCLKVLSESLGKLSIHLKDKEGHKVENHDALRVLKVRANDFMSPSTFKTLMEFNRNHYGNSYAYIKYGRNKGELKGIYPLDPRNVSILINNTSEYKFESDFLYEYRVPKTGKSILLKPEEVLHFKGGLSDNGIVGKSVRETLGSTIRGAKESQSYLNNLYENGLTANAVIKYTGELNQGKKENLIEEIANFASNESSERIIPIPLGMDIQPIDLKLTDSQFYELKKFTSLQIAAAFGIKPNHLNDYEKSSYANSEMQNLTFYIDTLLYILTHYEEEFNYKLLSAEEREKYGYHFEINVATILRGDLKTQADSLARMTQGSIYEINEARSYLGLPKIDGGDVIMVNGSYVDLGNIGKAYSKYEDKGGEKVDDNSKK